MGRWVRTKRFLAQCRLSVPESCILIGYFAIVTFVVLLVFLDWASAGDEPDFSGIWLFAVAPLASIPIAFTSLSGNAFLLGVYALFLLEFALLWVSYAGIRARALRRSIVADQPPGWYADPSGANTWRWWDGNAWTSLTG